VAGGKMKAAGRRAEAEMGISAKTMALAWRNGMKESVNGVAAHLNSHRSQLWPSAAAASQ